MTGGGEPSAQPGRDNPNRIRGILRLTLACNERCLFCNEPAERYPCPHPSPEAVEAQLQEFVATGQDTLTISGGEPTLRREPLLDLVRRARGHGVASVVLQTNAVRIDDEFARALAEAGLTEGFVSLLSHDAALHDRLMGREGTHARCLAGIDALLRAGVAVTLNPVFTADSQHTVVRYVEFVAARLRLVRFVSLSVVQPNGRAAGNPALLPDYAVLGPEIRAALTAADHHGIKVINPYCGVPVCVGWQDHLERCTEGLEALTGGFQDTPGIVSQDQKSHGPPCGGCTLRPRCGGAWRDYWRIRHGSGIRPVGARIEPWLAQADEAAGQTVVRAPGGPDATTWEAVARADTATVWLWTDRLAAGDALRLGASRCTDLALELNVRALPSLRETLREARRLCALDSRAVGAIRTRLILGLSAASVRELPQAVTLAVSLGVGAVRLLVPEPARITALVRDLEATYPRLELAAVQPSSATSATGPTGSKSAPP